jgi:hypothetical protein
VTVSTKPGSDPGQQTGIDVAPLLARESVERALDGGMRQASEERG